jgi:two-component system response regulator HupR/HoxA
MTVLAKDGAYLTSAIMSPGLLAAAARRSGAAVAGFTPQGQTLKEKIESLEKYLVRDALARHKWNRSRVAEELGLSRVGLANKIRRYGLNEQSGNGS